jgi:hypothetical protein
VAFIIGLPVGPPDELAFARGSNHHMLISDHTTVIRTQPPSMATLLAVLSVCFAAAFAVTILVLAL